MPSLSADDYRKAIKILGIRCDYSYDNKDSALFHCVYHRDRSPSLGINFKKGIYSCFQCHRSGSISKLVKEQTGKSIFQLLNKFDDLEIFSTKMDEDIPYQRVAIHSLDVRGTLQDFHQFPEAIQYLNYRGIDLKVAENMGFTFCKEAYINGTHMINRLMIPIYNDKGQLINIEGRSIDPNNKPKCLYPARSVKPIYEWYKLDKTQDLKLFEGLIKMSVARSDPYFTNSSATLGSNFTDYQISQLNTFSSVTLIRDVDSAGEKMAKKIKETYKGRLKVMITNNILIKDVDEIPTNLHISVKEFRESGGFIEDIQFM